LRYCYSAFGLTLTADHELPGLTARPPNERPDVCIRVGTLPPPAPALSFDRLWYATDEQQNRLPSLRVWRSADDSLFRLLYADDTEFVVDRAGTAIWTRWAAASTLEDMATYLLGPVLGFVLRLRGVTCLHASAVVIGGRAIALLGPAGAGKSTTAAALGRLGFPVMTDDVLALTDGAVPHVQPAYPLLRLWPESVDFLFGDANALPKLTPTWEKRALDLAGAGQRFETSPRPLAAIYLLSEPNDVPADAGRSRRDDAVQPLLGTRGLLALLANTYVGYLLDSDMRRQEFDALARLQSQVHVRRVVAPTDNTRFPQLCNRIIGDYAAL
jgi:hypothetical protein